MKATLFTLALTAAATSVASADDDSIDIYITKEMVLGGDSYLRVFIDFNDNGVEDTGEFVRQFSGGSFYKAVKGCSLVAGAYVNANGEACTTIKVGGYNLGQMEEFDNFAPSVWNVNDRVVTSSSPFLSTGDAYSNFGNVVGNYAFKGVTLVEGMEDELRPILPWDTRPFGRRGTDGILSLGSVHQCEYVTTFAPLPENDIRRRTNPVIEYGEQGVCVGADTSGWTDWTRTPGVYYPFNTFSRDLGPDNVYDWRNSPLSLFPDFREDDPAPLNRAMPGNYYYGPLVSPYWPNADADTVAMYHDGIFSSGGADTISGLTIDFEHIDSIGDKATVIVRLAPKKTSPVDLNRNFQIEPWEIHCCYHIANLDLMDELTWATVPFGSQIAEVSKKHLDWWAIYSHLDTDGDGEITAGEIREKLLDFNEDGCVGSQDAGLLLANWGVVGDTAGDFRYDITGDGTVDSADYSLLLADWSCPAGS